MDDNAEIVNMEFREILLAIQDVVGKHGTDTILRHAKLGQYVDNFPPSDLERGGHQLRYLTQINRALFDVFGPPGARAIMSRVGRVRATSVIEEYALLASTTKRAAKGFERRRRVKSTLLSAAEDYGENLGTSIKVVEEGDVFYWEDLRCGNCIDWHAGEPVCFIAGGFIYGLVAWILEKEDFKVEEVACRAKGDSTCEHRLTLDIELQATTDRAD
jgi:hypothetical protein